MPDLMTANGRALMLRQIEPRLRRLEANIERQAQPWMRSIERQAQPLIQGIRGIENPTWAKLGGGVLGVAAIVMAVTFFTRPTASTKAAAAKPQPKRVSAPRKRPAAAAQRRAPARKAAARPSA